MENSGLDKRDIILQSTVKTIMVPKFTKLEPLTVSGHRFLAASTGIWIEIYRPWVHLILPVSVQSKYTIPYGSVSKKIEFKFGNIPMHLINRFMQDARREAPFESAAWITWNSSGEFGYRALEPIEQEHFHIQFKRPPLPDGTHLIVDLHSHGHGHAFFSPEDDADDKDQVKLSFVFGSFNEANITFKARICTMGDYYPLTLELNG
jgi:PRTRC genetic system protein A